MKTLSQYGTLRDIVPDTKDDFKNLCPVCGQKLSLKRIKKPINMHRRSLKSFICPSCGYAEYDSNPREKAITDGILDDEL